MPDNGTNIMDFVSTIFKALKLPVKIIIIVAVFALLLLLLPPNIIEALSLQDIISSYRQWIGLTFLFAFAIIIVNICYLIFNIIRNNIKIKKRKRMLEIINKNIDKKLADLDPLEKSVLREFVIQSSRTIKLPVTDPTVANLISNHILENVGQYAQNTIFGFLYNLKISDYVDSKLTNEMIDLPNTELLTEADKQFIFNNRPPFMKQLLMFKKYL